MTISPRLVKGGIVAMDAASGAVLRVISLQYNPDSLTRTLQVQASGPAPADRSEAMRLKGPAVETYKLDAEIDLADQLEHPAENPIATEVGLHPQLAALEGLVHPPSARLAANDALARAGRLEIVPIQAPLTVFVWSRNRIVPVRLTDFSITEEAFDPNLNPIRAKVSLGMRVLTINDLGFDHRGGSLFMAYLRKKEQLATRTSSMLGTLGIRSVTEPG